MDETKFDLEIKRLTSKDDFNLPPEVRTRIDQTLLSIPQGRNRNTGLAVALSAIVLLMFGIFIIALVSPTAAAAIRSIPIVNSVFQIIGDQGLKNAETNGFSQYVNKTVTDSGISLTITDVIYDGVRISVGYRVSGIKGSPESLGTINPIVSKLLADGKPIDAVQYGGPSVLDSSMGVIDFVTKQQLPNKFTFNLVFNQINWGNKQDSSFGTWRFDIPLTKQPSITKVFKSGESKMVDGKTLTVKQITFSPISTEIDHKFESLNQLGDNVIIRVFDDKGNELEPVTGSIFEPVKTIPKYLIVKPYYLKSFGLNGGGIFSLPEVTAELNNLPVTLQQGEAGQVRITKAEFLPDKTLLYYDVEGNNPFLQFLALQIKDSSGKIYNPTSYPTRVGTNSLSFVQEFPSNKGNQKLFIVTRKISNPIQLDGLEIKVPLQ